MGPKQARSYLIEDWNAELICWNSKRLVRIFLCSYLSCMYDALLCHGRQNRAHSCHNQQPASSESLFSSLPYPSKERNKTMGGNNIAPIIHQWPQIQRWICTTERWTILKSCGTNIQIRAHQLWMMHMQTIFYRLHHIWSSYLVGPTSQSGSHTRQAIKQSWILHWRCLLFLAFKVRCLKLASCKINSGRFT